MLLYIEGKAEVSRVASGTGNCASVYGCVMCAAKQGESSHIHSHCLNADVTSYVRDEQPLPVYLITPKSIL